MQIPRRVQRGELIQAADYEALRRFALTLLYGQGRLKGRRDPDGFTPRVNVRATVNVRHPFKLSLGSKDGHDAVIIAPGTVAGIMPTIDGTKLDDVDESGSPPTLKLTDAVFGPVGLTARALILLRYNLRHDDFSVDTVEAIAAPSVPTFQPWTFHKLVGYVTNYKGALTIRQACFFDQQFDVTETTSNGDFKGWPLIDP